MGFSIQRKETVPQAVRRVMREQTDAVCACLCASGRSRQERYHEARKHLKKARSVLRLVRPEIGEKAFRRQNTTFRDVARQLSTVRDAQVLPKTLEALLEHYRPQVLPAAFNPLHHYLERRRRRAILEAGRQDTDLKKAEEILRDVLLRGDDYAIASDGWPALEDGLRHIYRQSRRRFVEAYADPADPCFHEWRKSVKSLRHQIDLLGECWEKPLEELSDQLHALSDYLGTDHDLAVLREKLGQAKFVGDRVKMRQEIFALIESRQKELRWAAYLLARRLFAEKPGAFARRLGEYWDAWHAPAEPVPVSSPALSLAG